MKFKQLFYLACVAMFASCATIENSEFARKKYYNFPLTKHTVTCQSSEKYSHPSSAVSSGETENKNLTLETKNEPEYILVADNNASVPAIIPNAVIKKEKKSAIALIGSAVVSNIRENNDFLNPFSFRKTMKAKQETFRYILEHRGNDNSALMILMIVAAILLPPLGVYIKDGRSPYFWLTAILCLLALIGLQVTRDPASSLFPIHHLFYVLYAITSIFALLIVLDLLGFRHGQKHRVN